MANVVAVQNVRVAAERPKATLDKVGKRRLTRTGKPSEPYNGWRLTLVGTPSLAGQVEILPTQVVRALERELYRPRANGGLGRFVDQNEAAGAAAFLVRVERHRPA